MKAYLFYRVFIGFTCQAPLYALYCVSQGLRYSDLMLLAVAFSAAKLAADIPAGLFADRVGRSAGALLRVALECASICLLLQGEYLASSIAAGVGLAFSSSAEAAMVYEWTGTDFEKVFGRAASWGHLSTAAAAVVGAELASSHYGAVLGLRLALLVGAGVLVLRFPAERRIVTSAPVIATPSYPIRLTALVGILGAAHLAALQLQQPYLIDAGIPLSALGVLFVMFQLATALGARLASSLRNSIAVVSIASISGFVLMALPLGPAAVLPLLAHKFVYGVSVPSVGRLLNQKAPPGARATAWSLRSLSEGAALAVFAPLMGWAADSYSLHAAFALAALLVLPTLFLSEKLCSAFGVSRSSAC